MTISRNIARNQFNRDRREAEHRDLYETEVSMLKNVDDDEHHDDMNRLLPILVGELSDSERELILLRYQGGKKT